MLNSNSSFQQQGTGHEGYSGMAVGGGQENPQATEGSSELPELTYFATANAYVCMTAKDYQTRIRILQSQQGGGGTGQPPKPSLPRGPSPKPPTALSSIAKLQQRLASKTGSRVHVLQSAGSVPSKQPEQLHVAPIAAVIFFATGELYLGYVQPDGLAFEGPGCLVSATGTFVVGEFVSGRCQGISLIRYANGDTTVAHFQKGIKDGECLSHNQDSGRKVRATFAKGTVVHVSGLTGPLTLISPKQNLTVRDVEEVFPEIEFSLEALIESSPLFLLYQDQEAFFVGNADKQLGLRIREGLGFDIGFFKPLEGTNSIQPHGHCRRVELSGNFVDGVFREGDLDGPAVCYLKTNEMWTHGIYNQFKALETLLVSPNHEVPPLVALQGIKFPGGSPRLLREPGVHIQINPFSLKELEFDYVKNAMEGTLHIDIKQEGPQMLMGRSEPEKQLMEVIQEEDEAESTRAGDSVWTKSAQCKVSSH